MSVSAPRPRLPTWPGHGPAASSCRTAPPPSQAAVRSPTAPTLSDKSSPKLNVILCGVLAANQIFRSRHQRGSGGADDEYGAVLSGVHLQPGGGEGRAERRVYCAALSLYFSPQTSKSKCDKRIYKALHFDGSHWSTHSI